MSRRSCFLLAILLAQAIAVAHAGTTAVPSANNSSFPPCLVLCPYGDIPFPVTVRDLANNTLVGASVVLDFSSCPAAVVCDPTLFPPPPYLWNPDARTARMFTDVNGQVVFPLAMGGVCGSASVSLYANGVFFHSYALASPDQDGNLVGPGLNIGDWPLFFSKLGTTDPTADFDCDLDVDIVDQGLMGQHDCHVCAGCADPVKRTTWGRVKTIYR